MQDRCAVSAPEDLPCDNQLLYLVGALVDFPDLAVAINGLQRVMLSGVGQFLPLSRVILAAGMPQKRTPLETKSMSENPN